MPKKLTQKQKQTQAQITKVNIKIGNVDKLQKRRRKKKTIKQPLKQPLTQQQTIIPPITSLSGLQPYFQSSSIEGIKQSLGTQIRDLNMSFNQRARAREIQREQEREQLRAEQRDRDLRQQEQIQEQRENFERLRAEQTDRDLRQRQQQEEADERLKQLLIRHREEGHQEMEQVLGKQNEEQERKYMTIYSHIEDLQRKQLEQQAQLQKQQEEGGYFKTLTEELDKAERTLGDLPYSPVMLTDRAVELVEEATPSAPLKVGGDEPQEPEKDTERQAQIEEYRRQLTRLLNSTAVSQSHLQTIRKKNDKEDRQITDKDIKYINDKYNFYFS